jgi:protein AaeX
MREFVVGGLLISPFVKYALLAGLLFIPLRLVLVHLDVHKWFWHPMLAESALYLCLLALINSV